MIVNVATDLSDTKSLLEFPDKTRVPQLLQNLTTFLQGRHFALPPITADCPIYVLKGGNQLFVSSLSKHFGGSQYVLVSARTALTPHITRSSSTPCSSSERKVHTPHCSRSDRSAVQPVLALQSRTLLLWLDQFWPWFVSAQSTPTTCADAGNCPPIWFSSCFNRV